MSTAANPNMELNLVYANVVKYKSHLKSGCYVLASLLFSGIASVDSFTKFSFTIHIPEVGKG